MTIGLTYWMLGGFDGQRFMVDAARQARDLGYDCLELCFGLADLTPDTSAAALAAMRDGIRETGMPVTSLITGQYWVQSLSSPDDGERTAAIDFTKSYLRAAEALGVDAVLVVPGAVAVPWDPGRPIVAAKTARDRALASMEELIPVAEATGVTMCLENVWNNFLTGPFEFAAFIDECASERVKAYFDAGNCMLNGYPDHWIEILGSRIERVHVKNFRRDGGAGTLDGFTDSLFSGDVPWERVFPALRSAGYDDVITAEILVSAKGLPDLEMAARVCGEMREMLRRYV